MKGIVNWYSDKKKLGLIEGQDGTNVMVYEKNLPFLTLLHAGDVVEYSVKKTTTGFMATELRKYKKRKKHYL